MDTHPPGPLVDPSDNTILLANEGLFFPLSLHIPWDPDGDDDQDGSPGNTENSNKPLFIQPQLPNEPPSSPAYYDQAIARIHKLVGYYLTPDMSAALTSLLSITHLFLSPEGGVHPLIQRIISSECSDDVLRDMANTVNAGLLAFLARGGRSKVKNQERHPSSPEDGKSPSDMSKSKKSSNSSRSHKVHLSCAERDRQSCCLSGKRHTGVVSHILPFSIKDQKAIDFWKFVSLFRGEDDTAMLRKAAFGSQEGTDHLKNVWWLAEESHVSFDKGWVAILPQITQWPYDPSTTSEYQATIEFPAGSTKVAIAVWSYTARGVPRLTGSLKPGDTIKLTTDDPGRLPLPHPLLFQLHAIISRVIAMKAAAGFPVLGDDWDSSECGVCGVEDWCEYDEEMGKEEGEGEPIQWSIANYLASSLDPTTKPYSEDYSNEYIQSPIHLLCHQEARSNNSVPLLAPANKKRRRDDRGSSDSDSGDDHEKPRKVEVVKSEHQQRMNEMKIRMTERLGRCPDGSR